jgi:hypothetical protein
MRYAFSSAGLFALTSLYGSELEAVRGFSLFALNIALWKMLSKSDF